MVAKITTERVKKFLWQSIICRFEVPNTLIANNNTQFNYDNVKEFYEIHNIRLLSTLVEHPQSNGQVEAANTVVLNNLKST